MKANMATKIDSRCLGSDTSRCPAVVFIQHIHFPGGFYKWDSYKYSVTFDSYSSPVELLFFTGANKISSCTGVNSTN